MQELDQRNGSNRVERQKVEPILELKLPRVAESVLVGTPVEPEPRQKPAAPAWAKALTPDGEIEQTAPRLNSDVRKAFSRFFEESPSYSGLLDQSLKHQAETQRALLKTLGVPEGELVAIVQDGAHNVLGRSPSVTIKTQGGTLVADSNGYFKFDSESNQLSGGSGIDQFRENAQTLAKLLKQSPAELLRLQREKPVSEEFSKLLTSKLQQSLSPKLFADTELSVVFDKHEDSLRLTLEHKSKDGDSVFAQISIPFSEFEKPGAPAAKIYESVPLKSMFGAKDAVSIDHGLKSICPRGIPFDVLVPKSMAANSLPLYGCEWKDNTISRYDSKTQKTEIVHELKDGETAVFRFDSTLPGLRAKILDGKKQEVASFTFKR